MRVYVCSSNHNRRANERVVAGLKNILKYAGLLFVSGLVLSACAGDQGVGSPLWANRVQQSGYKNVQYLSQLMVGEWVCNDEQSDIPQEVILRSYKRSKHYKRGPANRDGQGRPSMIGAEKENRQMGESRFVGRFKKDPRLVSLFTSRLTISFANNKLSYSYVTGETRVYPLSGEPVSYDDNINIAFGEWEYGKFVIEQNGPGGSVTEYWVLSPDSQQLHVRILIQPNGFSESITLNRLFDRNSISGTG